MTQREMMRRLIARYGRDRDRIIKAYADAERRGDVPRKSNKYDLSPESYAAALFRDGVRRGWIR